MNIAIGSDHGGVELKAALVGALNRMDLLPILLRVLEQGFWRRKLHETGLAEQRVHDDSRHTEHDPDTEQDNEDDDDEAPLPAGAHLAPPELGFAFHLEFVFDIVFALRPTR